MKNYVHIRLCSFRATVALRMPLVGQLRPSPILSGVRFALSRVLCIVFFFLLQTFPIVDSLRQVFCDNTIENLLVKLGLL